DLRIVLESADAGTVSCARIDDDIRPALWIDDDALRRNNAHQRVIHRLCELPSVDDHLVVEVQDRRQSFARALDEIIAALPKRVAKEDRALRAVDRVPVPIGPKSRSCRSISKQRADLV